MSENDVTHRFERQEYPLASADGLLRSQRLSQLIGQEVTIDLGV
jgi:hypothetical protein